MAEEKRAREIRYRGRGKKKSLVVAPVQKWLYVSPWPGGRRRGKSASYRYLRYPQPAIFVFMVKVRVVIRMHTYCQQYPNAECAASNSSFFRVTSVGRATLFILLCSYGSWHRKLPDFPHRSDNRPYNVSAKTGDSEGDNVSASTGK